MPEKEFFISLHKIEVHHRLASNTIKLPFFHTAIIQPLHMNEQSKEEFMIEAVGLSKYYGDFIAVEDLNISIRKGEVVAFLGPNGAGKSTTMKMLTGYLAPSAGIAKVCGLEVANNRSVVANRIGYLPENGPLYDEMTPIALLNFFGDARSMDPVGRADRNR